MKRKLSFFILILLFSTVLVAKSPYPEIKNLSADDVLFNQYSVAVSKARKALASQISIKNLPLEIYLYKVKAEETIFSISARCCIPYDAIVTLNRINSINEVLEGRTLLLPSLPALYLPKDPHSALEMLNVSFIEKNIKDIVYFEFSIYDNSKKRPVVCIPDCLLDGTTRSFFLIPYYVYPLPDSVLTSGFGMRKDPFTGKDSFHSGIDLAAPLGTPVLAVANGTVVVKTYNRVLGNHIIIKHSDGRVSVYGHLSKFLVSLNDKVKSGNVVGFVGNTGRATGPHLHFEIREDGVPKNPEAFLDKRR